MGMKKIIAMLLALAMMFALCACGRKDSETQTNANTQTTAQSTSEFADAVLSAEDIEITKVEEGKLSFKVKIRNVSERDLDSIHFVSQALDKNGDVLCALDCGGFSVAAGQAIWSGPYTMIDSHLDEATSMCFVTTVGIYAMPFRERTIFQLEDHM